MQTSGKQSEPTLTARIESLGTSGISAIRKNRRSELLDVVVELIIEVTTFHNVSRNMNAAQIAQTAQRIVDTKEYYFLNPTELKKCFDRGCEGAYGVVYDRMDGSVLFEWLKKYDQERTEQVMALRKSESDQHNTSIYDLFQNETMKTILTDVHSKLAHKEVVREPYVAPAKHPIAVQIEAEWDELPKIEGQEVLDLRAYHLVPFSFTTFYNLRFEELTHQGQIQNEWDALHEVVGRKAYIGTPATVLYRGKEMGYTEFYNTRFEEIIAEQKVTN